jgi:carboxyl-terminal processing protease
MAQKRDFNQLNRKASLFRVLVFSTISLTILCGSLIFSHYIDSGKGEKTAATLNKVILGDAKKAPFPRKSGGNAATYQTTSELQILSDSILSIMQSYYVDPDRVNNQLILLALVDVLSKNSRIKARLTSSENRESSDQNTHQISSTYPANEKKISLYNPEASNLKENVTDQELLLQVDQNAFRWSLSHNISHNNLAELYVQITKVLEKFRIKFPLAEGEVPLENRLVSQETPLIIELFSKTLSTLDAHSALLSPQAYRELRQGTEGSFGGLGVLVGIRDHLLTVIKPLPKSPAQRFGIKTFDRIVGINGKDTFGFTLEQLVEYMRGEPGTDVHLSLLRKDAATPIQVHLKREIIQVDSISSEEIVSKKGAYLKINIENFASRTSREVLTAIKNFKNKHHGQLDGLILDLRSNPGGLLDQAVQVADLFLPSGVIVSTRGRREEVEKAGSGIDEMSFPIMTLIDGDSASASEIVAGALQDHGRSLIIGQPSFGKGSVQTIFELPQERALKITIARYYTPSGRSIQNVGIIPDLWLQPIFQKKSNENLLGSYRYKNERYLRNHLEGAKESGTTSLRVPAIKSYYLAASSPDLEYDESSPKELDREREIALLILRKIHSTYKGSPTDLALRASHWLGLAGPEVTSRCNDLDQEAIEWLEKKHDIHWNKPKWFHDGDLASLQILEAEGQATIGDDYKIPFAIKNNSQKQMDRVSIFLRSEHPMFETQEILIGGIGAGQTINGHLRFPIPNTWEPGILALRIGIALDSWPVSSAVANQNLTIGPRKLASIKAWTSLIEEKTGRSNDSLESKEKAKIRVTLENNSQVPASDVVVRVINLSGKQAVLGSAPQSLKSLLPKQTILVDFDIEGSQILHVSSLDFGLQIESQSIKSIYKNHFKINSIPNSDISIKKTQNLGH